MASITASTTGSIAVPLPGLRRQDDRRLADVCEQVSGDVFGGEAVMDHCGNDATLQLVGRVLSVPQPDACALGWCEPQ
jgi:hypothetical protein